MKWNLKSLFCNFEVFFQKDKFRNVMTNQKLKIMICLFHQNGKKNVLEMVLKSFILSKLDHQMSKSRKGIVVHELKTMYKFDRLKN